MQNGDLNYAARRDFMFGEILAAPNLLALLTRESRLAFLGALSHSMRQSIISRIVRNQSVISEWQFEDLTEAIRRNLISMGFCGASEIVLYMMQPGVYAKKFPGLTSAQIEKLRRWKESGAGASYTAWAKFEISRLRSVDIERRRQREAA